MKHIEELEKQIKETEEELVMLKENLVVMREIADIKCPKCGVNLESYTFNSYDSDTKERYICGGIYCPDCYFIDHKSTNFHRMGNPHVELLQEMKERVKEQIARYKEK